MLSDKKLEVTKNNLIKQAIESARAKADIVASAAGMKVAGVRSINLNEFAIQPPFPPTPIPLAKQSLAGSRSQTNSYYIRTTRGHYQCRCYIYNSITGQRKSTN